MEEKASRFFSKHQITPNSIRYVIREEKRSAVCLTDGRIFYTYITLKDILDDLPQEQFLRVNKSYILNLAQIASVVGGVYTMRDGRVFVGRIKGKQDHDRIARSLSSESMVNPLTDAVPLVRQSLIRTIHQSAMEALLRGYYRVLKVDLTNDNYIVIHDTPQQFGDSLPKTISGWLQQFRQAGFIHPDDCKDYDYYTSLPFLRDYFAAHSDTLLLRYRRKQNSGFRWVMMQIVPAEDFTHQSQIVYLYIMDIHNSVNSTSATIWKIFQGLSIEYSSIFYVDFDRDSVISYRSNRLTDERYGELLKREPSYALLSTNYIREFAAPEEQERLLKFFSVEQLKACFQKKDTVSTEYRSWIHGQEVYVRVQFVNISEENGLHKMVVAFSDISTEKQLEQLQRDDLTGLYERKAFNQHASRYLRSSPDKQFQILLSDIEDFKVVNERSDRRTCDEMLSSLAQLLRKNLPGYVMGQRIYADKFAFLLEGVERFQLEPVLEMVHQWERRVGISVNFGFIQVDPTVSIYTNCDRAQMVLDSVKGVYGIPLAEYNEAFRQELLWKRRIATDGETSLHAGHFRLHFQPKLDLHTGKLGGAEALVRWCHPELGCISPSQFVHQFERSGFITRLDDYLCHELCRELKRWQEMGLKLVPISINLSRRDFENDFLADGLCRIVDSFGIHHDLIHFELTESAHTSAADKVEATCAKLHELGFRIELDDFGTGYSSLVTLSSMKLDCVKIDKSLVDRLDTPSGSIILRQMVALAKELGLRTIAEGVETEGQREKLAAMGCDYVQGYYYSRPVDIPAFEALMRANGSE